MIITKETQERLLDKYMQNHSTIECTGFVDGMNEAFKLTDKILKDERANRSI
jgi:UDP-N-acetylglucosamine:LPS N-acetylglucosamine transferase